MKRLKKMPVGIRRDLERAGEIAASGGTKSEINKASGERWCETNEFDMCKGYTSELNVKEVLMFIALLLTMPEEILNHECKPIK